MFCQIIVREEVSRVSVIDSQRRRGNYTLSPFVAILQKLSCKWFFVTYFSLQFSTEGHF